MIEGRLNFLPLIAGGLVISNHGVSDDPGERTETLLFRILQNGRKNLPRLSAWSILPRLHLALNFVPHR